MKAEVEMIPNVPRRIATSVLPWVEEMATADRQTSTATTFKSMMAEGLMSRSRGRLFIHALKLTHMHTHACAPAVTHPPHCSLLSLWRRVPVATATEWVCVRKPCSLQASTGLMRNCQDVDWPAELRENTLLFLHHKVAQNWLYGSRLQEKLTRKQKCA